MPRTIGPLLLCVVASGLAQAGPPAQRDPLLDKLAGHWVLRGTIDGKTTTHDLDAAWVLGNEYLEFHETSREKAPSGEPAYEATVFLWWHEGKRQYNCLWLDNTAVMTNPTLGVAARKEDEIAFVFPTKPPFHTTFAYDHKKDVWTWRMDGEDHGKLTPFARVELTRQ